MLEFGVELKDLSIDKILEKAWMGSLFILYFFKKVYDFIKSKLKKDKSINFDIKQLSLIYEKLIECRLQFNASRVTITQFHNGDYYYSNNSILKMSITHETDEEGVSRVIDNYQNVNVSKYNKFLDSLMKEEMISYSDISNTETHHDDDMLLDLKVYGTESFNAIKLMDKKGNIIGFIALSFSDNVFIDNAKFKEYSNMVSFLLRK